MGKYADLMKSAKKPFEDGFPFGSFRVELKQLEIKTEKGGKGEYKEYWAWHLQLVELRHASAQGSKDTIVKLRRDFASDFGISDNTAIAAAFAGKTFEEYQNFPEADIEAYLANLQDEKACAEKHRQIVLEVTPDMKGYRRYHAYTVGNAPASPFVFDPAMVAARPKDDGATAAAEAGKGTAAKPPASTL